MFKKAATTRFILGEGEMDEMAYDMHSNFRMLWVEIPELVGF